jgi:hypothetical protein
MKFDRIGGAPPPARGLVHGGRFEAGSVLTTAAPKIIELMASAKPSLAHAGATGVELIAVSGHSSLDQVQVYIDEVEQERAAEASMVKLTAMPEIKVATTGD